MSKIPTAKKYLEDNYDPCYDEDNNPIYHVWQIKKAMVEFAKLHVEAALKEASTKLNYNKNFSTVQKEILNSYSLENIK